jgi:hypothetical protein
MDIGNGNGISTKEISRSIQEDVSLREAYTGWNAFFGSCHVFCAGCVDGFSGADQDKHGTGLVE